MDFTTVELNARNLYHSQHFNVDTKNNLIGFSSWKIVNIFQRFVFWIKDVFTSGKETKKVHDAALKTLQAMKTQMVNDKFFYFRTIKCFYDTNYFTANVTYNALLEKIKKYSKFKKINDIKNFSLPILPEHGNKFSITKGHESISTRMVKKDEKSVSNKTSKIEKFDFTKNLKISPKLTNNDKEIINIHFLEKIMDHFDPEDPRYGTSHNYLRHSNHHKNHNKDKEIRFLNYGDGEISNEKIRDSKTIEYNKILEEVIKDTLNYSCGAPLKFFKGKYGHESFYVLLSQKYKIEPLSN
jgi:hypothetical protein